MSFVARPANVVIGPLVIIAAILIAGMRPRTWRCEQCGAQQKRADRV